MRAAIAGTVGFVLALDILALNVAFGQAGKPEFEVASVKPASRQDRVIGMFTRPGGRITITLYTLKMLIHEAYGVQAFQISGGQQWTDEDRYDIEAKPPANSPSSKYSPANPKLPPPQEELLMLQSLLADRFKLKVHTETREGPVYELAVGDKGPKLEAAKSADDFPVVAFGRSGRADQPDFMRGENASMQLLAARLALELGRPVLDQTGLKGSFDFEFRYAKDDGPADASPSLFSAIQEQLGLKLVPAKGPVEILVIDSAEKPSAN
jgi:uncharacterized protein (TIGR03435 family)